MSSSSKLSEFTQRAVSVFRECSLIPAATRARIFPRDEASGCFEVEATWSQRELERGKKVSFTKSYFIQRKGQAIEKLCNSTFQSDATQVVKVAYSSDNSVKAVLLKDKPAKAEPAAKQQQYIEVWSGGRLTKTIDVETLKKHGTINEDTHFGSFQLSPDGRQLLYVAEREKPKSCSFFKKEKEKEEGEEKKSEDDSSKSKPIPGTEYVYESDWGEQLTSVVNPLPVVLDLQSEECTVINTSKLGDISAGQAQWVPGEKGGVVFIGWENKPRKLGFIYCFNRRSAVYYWNNGEFTNLTDSTKTVFFPRFNPQGTKLIFFESLAGGPHRTCAALKMVDWSSKSVSTVIDIVERPTAAGGFAGFYSFFFPERCWDSLGVRLVSEENWGSRREVTITDTDAREVKKVTTPAAGGEGERKGAWSVLDVSCDLVVAQFSSPNTPPRLFVGVLPEDQSTAITWTQLSAPTQYEFLDGQKYELLTFNPDDGSGLTYQAIFLSPKTTPTAATPPPLVVLPHGGPHTLYSTEFYAWPTCLAALGFAVLFVNYRGSTGYGQDGVFSLPGKVGSQDVNDVQRAAVSLVERGVVDKDRIVVMGGSHGGFISAHLIGQFPEFYKAASMRNPALNQAVMYGVSDIPDWCFVECGMTYDPTKPATAEDMAQFLSHSPTTLADKIKVPVLFSLGGEDRRVPICQGLELYHILKARGIQTKLLMYPKDSHPIMSVWSDADSFINTAVWFYRYAVLKESQ